MNPSTIISDDPSESAMIGLFQIYMNNLTIIAKKSLDSVQPLLSFEPLVPCKENNFTIMSTYNYSNIFGFEKMFESKDYVIDKRDWMARNWTWSVYISLLYIALVVIGKWFMNSRPKYDLRLPLIAWNLLLGVFSIFGAIRTWPEFIDSIFSKSLEHSICSNKYAYGVTGFWAYMFIMSKLPELVDTLFIVLRKRELIFLHYYHHATVFIYCWYSYSDFSSTGRWFMNMNYLVHAVMYTYFALKAMHINVPKFISKIITMGQIAQMVFGCFVNYIAWQAKTSSRSCNISNENIIYSFAMYFSYFGLFFHFFLNSYVYGRSTQKAVETKRNTKKVQ